MKMKKIKYLGIIVSLMLIISYSCNKEELSKDENYSENSMFSEDEIVKKRADFNAIFSNRKKYKEFKNQLLDEAGTMFDSYENIVSAYKNNGEGEIDLKSINVYMEINRKEKINVFAYFKDVMRILIKSDLEFEDLRPIIVKYDVYSNEQFDIFVDFADKAVKINNKSEFKVLLSKFEDELYNSNLPEFDRNVMLSYAATLQLYNPEIFNSNLKISSACQSCINKHGRAIFGFWFLIAQVFAVACLIVGFANWIAAAICIIIGLGISTFSAFWEYCRIPCF